LTDGKVSKSVTATERISSTVTEKTKSRTAREGKESQDKPLMMNRLSITPKKMMSCMDDLAEDLA
jgi:hypothetical protein